MSLSELHWFDDRDPRVLLRWGVAVALVVGVHAALIAGNSAWRQPVSEVGELTSVITVDLAPIDTVADAHQRDIAPGPEDMVEQKPTPEVEKQPEEQPKVEEPPPPPAATADVALPEPKPPQKVEEQHPPAPTTTARVEGGAPRVPPSWLADLFRRL